MNDRLQKNFDRSSLIAQTESFVRSSMPGDRGSHDWEHIRRVRDLSLKIAENEAADLFVVEMAALLHDIADHKFTGGDTDAGPKKAAEFMKKIGLEKDQIEHVVGIINDVSFKGAGVISSPSSVEGQIVQDADRLDAMGAIGIARAFSYGGYRNRSLYDPDEVIELHKSFESYQKSTSSTVAHFYEKLFLLKDRMNTDTGRAMAEKRHAYMTDFIEQFINEWHI